MHIYLEKQPFCPKQTLLSAGEPAHFNPFTLEQTLFDQVFGRWLLGLSVSSIFRKGLKPFATVALVGTSVQFHQHSATWFALTHGRMAWWLAPPSLANALQDMANAPGGEMACMYLSEKTRRPHPSVTFVVQKPGEIIIFGEGVAHASCALELSLGVGMEMGYTNVPYFGARGLLLCKSALGDGLVSPLCTLDRSHWEMGASSNH